MSNESEDQSENSHSARILQQQLAIEQLENEPEKHPASVLVSGIVESNKENAKRVHGHINIETEVPEGLNVLLCVYPSGDAYFWFVAYGFFTFIVLVDEKWKCLALVPCNERAEFLAILNQTTNSLNIKNHYPVENVDEFTPTPTGRNENPPDQDNE